MTATLLSRRLALALVLSTGLAACVTAPPPAPGADKPRLVVLIVIDGLPMRQLTGVRDQLAPDGFARFLDRGTWFADARHGQAHTDTAVGHAAMLTGAYPHRTGIIANDWREPASGERQYCAGDTGATTIGHKTAPLDGTSPKNLRVQTLGDVLRHANPASKVIAVSGKDRGAILTAGHLGTAYIYMQRTGQFASSTYYMAQHPAWVDAFNAARPADRWFGSEWTALLPAAAYAGALPANQPWFGKAGGTLPMRMAGKDSDAQPTPAYYASLLASPYADALTLDFARAAIAGESLGQRGATDILSISLSGHDYVNHAWSAESAPSHDHLLQLDRMLQDFFALLDATIGRDRYVAVLTADHGFMPAPEVSRARGLDAGRVGSSELLAHVNAGLEQRFGVPRLAAFVSASGLVIDRQLLAQRGLDADTVNEAARALLLAEPSVAAAYTRVELLTNSRPGAEFFEAIERSWHKDLSGDVPFVLKPHWMAGAKGATHGSPHPYDTHVPILIFGPAWVGAGRIDGPVAVVDIAPTLARLMGLPAPAASEGRLLPLPRPWRAQPIDSQPPSGVTAMPTQN